LPARQSAKPKEISDGIRTTGDVIISAPHVAATALLYMAVERKTGQEQKHPY